MKVLLFGASGEIGARLSEYLIKEKYDVCFASRSRGIRLNVYGDAIKFIKFDFNVDFDTDKLINDFDVIINCAIQKSGNTDNEIIENNKKYVDNLLEYTRSNNSKLIDLSSMAVLPPRVTSLAFQNKFEYSSEEDWYSISKIETEKILLSSKHENVNSVSIRAGIVYGPHMHWSNIAFNRTMNFEVVVPSIENSICHAIHVDDLCHLIIHLMNYEGSTPKIIYGINPEKVTWHDFYHLHGLYSNFEEGYVRMLPAELIKKIIKVKGDELMLPGIKRRIIDFFRSLNRYLRFSELPPINRIVSFLKKLNKGLIDSEVRNRTKPSFFPNEFELELYQTNSTCDENLEELFNFKYSIPFKVGVKNTCNWFKYQIHKS